MARRASENAAPEFEIVNKILNRHFDTPLSGLVIERRTFPGHIQADLQVALDQIFEERETVQLFGLNPRHMHDGVNFQMLTESDERMAARIGPLTYTDVQISSSQTVRCLGTGLWLDEHGDTPYAVRRRSWSAAYVR